jgi:hypothetical protein
LIGYLVCQLIASPEHCRYPSFHKRLKDWLAHFNGVASKYLDNYLAWFRFLDSKGFEKTKENLKTYAILPVFIRFGKLISYCDCQNLGLRKPSEYSLILRL